MPQITFTLPPPSKSARADRYLTEGFEANAECNGRGRNPYPSGSRRADWWDQGWCEAELSDLPPERREELERWLAAGNE